MPPRQGFDFDAGGSVHRVDSQDVRAGLEPRAAQVPVQHQDRVVLVVEPVDHLPEELLGQADVDLVVLVSPQRHATVPVPVRGDDPVEDVVPHDGGDDQPLIADPREAADQFAGAVRQRRLPQIKQEDPVLVDVEDVQRRPAPVFADEGEPFAVRRELRPRGRRLAREILDRQPVHGSGHSDSPSHHGESQPQVPARHHDRGTRRLGVPPSPCKTNSGHENPLNHRSARVAAAAQSHGCFQGNTQPDRAQPAGANPVATTQRSSAKCRRVRRIFTAPRCAGTPPC